MNFSAGLITKTRAGSSVMVGCMFFHVPLPSLDHGSGLMRGPTKAQIAMSELRPDAPTWLPADLIRELDGGLWHATDGHGFQSIAYDGKISPSAKAKYPNGFCRGIGAISLFDLSFPDPPPSAAHWSQWISRESEGPSYWLEIDRDKARPRVLNPMELLERWKREQSFEKMRIIARIESAHIGPIPLDCVKRVLVIEGRVWSEQEF
jgi:hypothetical protein